MRPGNDTVIDATAGNGHDTVQLARLIFPTRDLLGNSELIARDIQPRACEATRAVLDEYLSSIASSSSYSTAQREDSILNATRVLCKSHASIPPTANPIGLIAYNLGYLPGSTAKEIQPYAQSTLASLAAVVTRVRKGGLVSIVVYPDSEPSVDEIRNSTLTTGPPRENGEAESMLHWDCLNLSLCTTPPYGLSPMATMVPLGRFEERPLNNIGHCDRCIMCTSCRSNSPRASV